MAVSQEDNGTYTVNVWYREWSGARHKKHKRGFPTKRQARAWEANFLARHAGSPDMTFEAFCEIYIDNRRPMLKLNTLLTKQSIIERHLIPYFGGMKLDEITPVDVTNWQTWMCSKTDRYGKPFEASYLRTVRNQLAAIFNHAVKLYGLGRSPMLGVDPIGSRRTREMEFWTKEEYLRFSHVMEDKPEQWLAFEVLFWTGVREGELLALVPSDFDLVSGVLHVTKSYQRIHGEDVVTCPKTPKSVRDIALPRFLVEEVAEHIRLFGTRSDERLFKLTKSQLSRAIEQGSKKAGVKRIRVHDFRHSHVSS
jgi:integrase